MNSSVKLTFGGYQHIEITRLVSMLIFSYLVDSRLLKFWHYLPGCQVVGYRFFEKKYAAKYYPAPCFFEKALCSMVLGGNRRVTCGRVSRPQKLQRKLSTLKTTCGWNTSFKLNTENETNCPLRRSCLVRCARTELNTRKSPLFGGAGPAERENRVEH